ncbi:hypothetical protein K0M31_010501 [Melipona bicolor]|uniref:Uncharacterized protein n=1 Tax=Melipona bicolor TaxID=60889 RepID=A0AA40FL80_9HYME|nr:hypothetical protein K0M31_010501 [Melipona bicolor]
MLNDVNISAILDSFSVSYDKRVRPNYGVVARTGRIECPFSSEPSIIVQRANVQLTDKKEQRMNRMILEQNFDAFEAQTYFLVRCEHRTKVATTCAWIQMEWDWRQRANLPDSGAETVASMIKTGQTDGHCEEGEGEN